MADVARHWPGGIPEDVRFHPEPIPGPLISKVKGWQLFLEVEELPARYDLVPHTKLHRRIR